MRIYASEHGPVGSPYYIGKGRDKRAYKKNPVEIKAPKDKSQIIILFGGLSEQEAFDIEMRLIEKHGRIDLGTGCLRNRTNGGEGNAGAIRSVEMKARNAAAHRGRRHTPEARAKMSASRFGKVQSEETKARISAKHIGREKGPMSEECKLKLSISLTGRKRSKEFSENLSRVLKGHIITKETRDKIAASLTGKKMSLESRAKMSATHKLRWERYRESNKQADASSRLLDATDSY